MFIYLACRGLLQFLGRLKPNYIPGKAHVHPAVDWYWYWTADLGGGWAVGLTTTTPREGCEFLFFLQRYGLYTAVQNSV
jgi:hypothetical protein